MQLSGPHSRAYRRDVTGAPGFLKVVLHKLLGDSRLLAKIPYYSGPDTEGEVQVALTEYHCPDDAERAFREAGTRDVREQAGSRMVLAANIRPEFALGTMSRQYGVGDPPEPWPMHDSCILYYANRFRPAMASFTAAIASTLDQPESLLASRCLKGSTSGTTACSAPLSLAAEQSLRMVFRREVSDRLRTCGST